MRRLGWIEPAIFLAACISTAGSGASSAAQIWLKDGRILEGKEAPVSGLAETPKAPDPTGAGPLQLIVMVDDELRRTFVSKRQVQDYRQEDSTEIFETFRLDQRVMESGPTVRSVGPIMRVTPFDEFGRRIFTMNTAKGPVNVIQGMTEITPLWIKVEGKTHVWDMRLSTSSIPREVLDKILARLTKPDDVDQRIKVARFYLQAERYEDAQLALENILADIPGNEEVRKQLDPWILAIRQRGAQRLLDELKLRRDAGQHELVLAKLKSFPTDGVAGKILEGVRQMTEEHETLDRQRAAALDQIGQLLDKVEDESLRARIEPIRQEMDAELSANTMDRLASFRLMLDDDSLLAEEKLSLAVSGWLLGGDSATVKLPVSLSVYEVRSLVREYLNARDVLSRARILERFHSQEGGTPTLVAKLLAHMKPPVDTPGAAGVSPVPGRHGQDARGTRPAGQDGRVTRPGYYELEVPGLADAPPVKYLVQLPPEYDPYRRYPAIVTLNGAGTTPEQQVSWWAGDWTAGGWRGGQAARHGYVVIAPGWAAEHQKEYGYSAQEHAAVLHTLRDACRRFAIDTDRVFLSGHSIGGDAAWDIGLAHPDLWAGVIPIVARSDKYCAHYWENAKLVPFYFVAGELDGTKTADNARDLDRYLKRGYNATVVEYRGRGHEHFSDEILRLFDWMGRFRRNFFPKEFTTSTMRRWDNFFWWVELESLPSGAMVDPIDWPPRGRLGVETKASLTATNGVYVRTGAATVRVWLSPEMVDFDQRATVTVNGRRINPPSQFIEPNLETLLEDVRTRGDRQHPFWAKVETPTGRARAGR